MGMASKLRALFYGANGADWELSRALRFAARHGEQGVGNQL